MEERREMKKYYNCSRTYVLESGRTIKTNLKNIGHGLWLQKKKLMCTLGTNIDQLKKGLGHEQTSLRKVENEMTWKKSRQKTGLNKKRNSVAELAAEHRY